MIVILRHDPQSGEMQYITEGCDQLQGVTLMEQAVRTIRAQMGQPPVIGAMTPAAPAPPPTEPRPRNIREVIVPRGAEAHE